MYPLVMRAYRDHLRGVHRPRRAHPDPRAGPVAPAASHRRRRRPPTGSSPGCAARATRGTTAWCARSRASRRRTSGCASRCRYGDLPHAPYVLGRLAGRRRRCAGSRSSTSSRSPRRRLERRRAAASGRTTATTSRTAIARSRRRSATSRCSRSRSPSARSTPRSPRSGRRSTRGATIAATQRARGRPGVGHRGDRRAHGSPHRRVPADLGASRDRRHRRRRPHPDPRRAASPGLAARLAARVRVRRVPRRALGGARRQVPLQPRLQAALGGLPRARRRLQRAPRRSDLPRAGLERAVGRRSTRASSSTWAGTRSTCSPPCRACSKRRGSRPRCS